MKDTEEKVEIKFVTLECGYTVAPEIVWEFVASAVKRIVVDACN
ncbi:MAG: hypothetical protein QG670_2431 [Thermoproteota archaeon]|nr:hypothetical protein [Thermoproteota archaeon]